MLIQRLVLDILFLIKRSKERSEIQRHARRSINDPFRHRISLFVEAKTPIPYFIKAEKLQIFCVFVQEALSLRFPFRWFPSGQ